MKMPIAAFSKCVPVALMLAACAAICACTETRFASPPGTHLENCDARWKGLWLPKAEADSGSAFFIDDACRFSVLDQPKNGNPMKRTGVKLNYVHAGGKDYLVVADGALKGLVDIRPVYGIDPAPAHAYFFARYMATKDRIDVYSVDSEHVASQIVAEKLDGTVSKTHNELHVFVAGDSAHMLEILRDDSIFSSKPNIELERSNMTVGEFERRARKSLGDKKS
ncbi:MAG: hypothetical protein ABI304_08630 [Rudaea sp.]